MGSSTGPDRPALSSQVEGADPLVDGDEIWMVEDADDCGAECRVKAHKEDLCMLLGVVHSQSQSQSKFHSQADCVFNGPVCYVFNLQKVQ